MMKVTLPIWLVAGILLLHSSCYKKEEIKQIVKETPVWLPLADTQSWQADWKTDSVVYVQTNNEPDNLHPVTGTSQARSELNLYLHVSLLQTDLRTSEIRPGLCIDLPAISNDQLNLSFELRNDPTWDDGSPITAADVIFTIKASKCALINNPSTKPYFENIKDIIPNAVNSKKFMVQMKRPYFQNVAIWCDYPIIQRKIYDPENVLSHYSIPQFDDSTFKAEKEVSLVKWADWFNSYPAGTDVNVVSGAGPYKLSKWEPGQYLVLELKQKHWSHQSKNYWEKSYPKQIVYQLNKDAASQMLALKGQEYDVTTTLSASSLLDLKKDSSFNKNYHSAFVNTYGYTYIALNMKPHPGRNVALMDNKVRRALALSVPVQQMIDVVQKGVNKRVSGPVSFLKSSFDSSLSLIPFNPTAAAKLLNDAGWVDNDKDGIREKMMDGKKVKLSLELAFLSVMPEWREMAIMIKEGMTKSGVDVQLASLDVPVWMEKMNTRDFDMLMGAWNNTALPEDYSQLWSTNSFSNGGINFSGFGNDMSDALIDSMNVEMNAEKRKVLELKMQRIIYDEQPYIFLYGLVRRSVCHKRFSGASFYAERPGILFNSFQVNPGVRNVAEVNP
jgi:peptide/nickel transport system substrate-binding protein